MEGIVNLSLYFNFLICSTGTKTALRSAALYCFSLHIFSRDFFLLAFLHYTEHIHTAVDLAVKLASAICHRCLTLVSLKTIGLNNT